MALSQACGLIRLGWEAIGEKQNTHILRTLASSPRQHRPFVPSARARRHGQEVASRLPTQRWCPPRRQATSPCGTLHRHGGGWKHARARAAGSLERCRVSHLPLNAPPSLLHLHKAPHRVPSVLSEEKGPRPNATVGGGGVQRQRLRVLLVRLQQRLSLNTVLRNPK